jgi:tetratricopeptide (TPR) repeat protein
VKPGSSAVKTRKVFISYGRDKHASLAVRIRDDLRKRGHEVWFDEERLKPGYDWEAFIEQGIEALAADKANSAVVILLTPHSVRRPDGYCLNEVARALARGLRIIPLMVVETEPPLSICRVQWLDMRECIPISEKEQFYAPKFVRLLEAIEEGRLDFEGTQQRLLRALQPLEFDAERHEHALKFTGRRWVFDAVERWLAGKPGQRIFWIRGGPGTGKTALAAVLSSRYREVVALHLCRHGHSQKGNPAAVVTNIAYQLSTQLPDYEARLTAMDIEACARDDARTMFDNLIVQPLAGIGRPQREAVILIDALDEAGGVEHNELAEFIASEFPRTPQWLRLIVTSRPESEVEAPLQGVHPFDLDPGSEANRADIRTYLRRELAGQLAGRTDADRLLELVLDKSEGTFLYAKLFCDDIRLNELSLDRPEQFPQGLGGRYHQYFRRRFADPEKYRNQVRPVLRAILAARDPLPVTILQDIFGWDEEGLWDFIRALGSLFPVRVDAEEETRTESIRPFHRSLADWLTDHARSKEYYASLKEGHRVLADYFERQPLSPHKVSELPWQLAAAGLWRRLYELLANLEFFERCWQANQFDLKAYWARVEQNSELRMTDAYRPVVDSPGRVTDTDKVWHLGVLLSDTGHPEQALKLREFLTEHFRKIGDRNNYQASLGGQALILQARGELDAAMRLLKEKERICRELGDKNGLQASLGNQALILLARGEQDAAKKLLVEGESICRELGNKDGLQAMLGNRALILRARGELDAAMELHKEEELICRELGNRDSLQRSLGNQALILHVRGELDAAMKLYKEQECICRELGNKDGLKRSLGNQALILHACGELDAATKLYKEQERICRELGNPEGLAISLANQAELMSDKRNRPEDALPLAEEAYRLASDHGYAALAQQVKMILDPIRAKLKG